METAIRWLYSPFHVEPTHPWLILLALLAIPTYVLSRSSAGRVVFSSLRALPLGGQTWRTRLAWLPDALIAAAVIALAIALTGPRAGDQSARVRRDGIAIMMAVDVSGSMCALDLSEHGDEVTRLDAVKQAFKRFVLGGDKLRGRPDDAIGLVAFATYAETRSPLTLDHGNLALAASELTIARDEESATAVGAGLELAVQRLADHKARSKVAILLTDGESNVHDIDEDAAIDDAVKAGVKVYTIGAGTNGEALCKRQGPNGSVALERVPPSLDEALLRKLADRTHGQYFRATDRAALGRIYEAIDKLERSALEDQRFTEYRQFYAAFVAAALLLIIAAFALRGTVLRRLP
jgi:Ca-activated chloride channel homolog